MTKMAKQNNNPKQPIDWRRQAREVADSLAIAFILAMVIRHYILEVFKIPTKSMQPTLLGDPWTGDKILVNKFAYDFRDPQRWDVIVFKFPLDTSKNYIKRLLGLPGETVLVRDGDVFVNGEIARKPWRVQQALWRRRIESSRAEFWQPGAASPWRLEDNEFTVQCPDAEAPHFVTYQRDVLAYEDIPYAINSTDLMMQFLLVPQRAAGTVYVVIEIETPIGSVADRWEVRLPLNGSAPSAEVLRNGELQKRGEPALLREGRPTLVQVCHVDRTLLVRVGDREVARHEYRPNEETNKWPGLTRARVSLGCQGGEATFRRPAIFVDVYYTNHPNRYAVQSGYTLGSDDFLVLGDNSANSRDSRDWGPVPRRYLVGEAFLVLWPLARMKIVR